MLKKEKIRLMTDLAIYEKKYENDVFKINKYYKSDYIFWHMMLAFIRFTVCFLICLMLYVIFKSDSFFYDINVNGIMAMFTKLIFHYIAGVIVYLMISAAVYSARYKRARKGMLFYATKLKRLARRYNYQDKENT
ncbi:MAG: hypothetical protein MR011_00305 [Lachnospiraceae bacterium]|nr:hypothetical protein [Lachnospiraceae bacterium]